MAETGWMERAKQYASKKVDDFKQDRANSKEGDILKDRLKNITRLAAQVPECKEFGTYEKIQKLQDEYKADKAAYDAKKAEKGLVNIPVEPNAYYGGKKVKKKSGGKGRKKKGSKKKGSKKGSKKKK